jgi:hypothetical protein
VGPRAGEAAPVVKDTVVTELLVTVAVCLLLAFVIAAMVLWIDELWHWNDFE